MGVMVSLTAQRSLTPITAWMSGVFPSSSSLAACTSAPCASASAIRGRLCRREDRWRRAPGWSSLGSSGSDGTSCSISTSPLEDSSDSSSAGRQVTVIWREKCQQSEEISRKRPGCSVSQDILSVLYQHYYTLVPLLSRKVKFQVLTIKIYWTLYQKTQPNHLYIKQK